MNPITVTGPKGTYTVYESPRFTLTRGGFVEDGTTCYAVASSDYLRYFDKRPMALRHAAELAGVERQRVTWEPPPSGRHDVHGWITRGHEGGSFWSDDRGESPHVFEWAHDFAQRRYAAAEVTA